MEAKLDRSVPKDQVVFLMLAVLSGVAAGLIGVRLVFEPTSVSFYTIAYSIVGALLGTFYGAKEFRKNASVQIALLFFLAVSAFPNLFTQIGMIVVSGLLISWITAGLVISCYHAVSAYRDR